MTTLCTFCGQTGKEGHGLYHYNLAMTRIAHAAGWAHQPCMTKATADYHQNPGAPPPLPTQPETAPVPQDPAKAKRKPKVLKAAQPEEASPQPEQPKEKVVKPKPPKADKVPVEELLAKAVKLGYVEQPAPNGGIRTMRIKNYLKSHDK